MKKRIIGFIGDHRDKNIAIKILIKNGFYKVNIQDKVREFANHLFSKEELANEEKIIEKIRERGCLINKEYWINLVLMSIPKNIDFIILSDVLPNEIIGKKIDMYYISKDTNTENNYPDIQSIKYDGTENDLHQKLLFILKK